MSKVTATTAPEKLVTLLNGHEIHYDATTKFHVQTRKDNGPWEDKYVLTGNLVQATFYYNSTNVGPPYTKRLFAPSFKGGKGKQVLALLVGEYERPG